MNAQDEAIQNNQDPEDLRKAIDKIRAEQQIESNMKHEKILSSNPKKAH